MTETHYRLAADGIEVVFDPGSGMLRELAVTRDGRRSAPYAKAPWRDLPMDDPRFPAGTAPHLARLSIDFFCAPFAADDIEGTAPHGKTANGRWRLVGEGRRGPVARATFVLDGSIAGLTVTKTLLVIDGHPFLYQQHVLAGATVAIPVAHHAMVDASGGLELTTSPKAFAETAGTPIETDPALGRSILAYPARSDPRRFPRADGTTADL